MMKWTPQVIFSITQEEQALRILVESNEEASWEKIAKEMNLKFNRNSRTGRQCR